MIPRRKSPAIAKETPQEITLYPSRKAWLPVLVISLVFCVIGVWMISKDDWRGWLGLSFFGLCALVSALMVTFPQVSSLRLTIDGFYMGSLIRTQFTRWRDVTGFGVASISMNKMVVFNYSASYSGQRFGRKVAADLAGWEGALPDTYGMSADELANLMNSWKRRSEAQAHGEKPATGET